ncbi:V-type proton ATPase subunit C 1-B isoform X2 [Brachyhypopomus gauderio]|uniref:V-type proton ATPase subunit C 1-B isoform X2 n=1 Tax=Brachyhypopomus gauderio TaxID=698409 RepID=UPI0040423DCA
MTEFWLVSVPLDKVNSQALEDLKQAASKDRLGTSVRFLIPELKLGTLDVLLGVCDALAGLDSYVEVVMRKSSQCMAEITEESSHNLLENITTNGEHRTHHRVPRSPLKAHLQALQVDLITYVTKFQWDRSKYPTVLSLKTLTEVLLKQVTQVETELTSRFTAYNNVKANMQGLEKKAEGRLQTRALTHIVKKEDLVLNSEYLTTLVVVVSRESIGQWENTYESMSEFVVPRSSRKLLEEEDAVIFTVTLFKKAVSEFKGNAKKHKFTVREFNLVEAERQKEQMCLLRVEKKEQHGTFLCWLKVNVKEVFIAWIHVKALRVFAESVLRYGLPVSFQAVLIKPEKKHAKQLREQLNTLFTHLDPMAAASKLEVGPDELEVNVREHEYFSYICYPINMNSVTSS